MTRLLLAALVLLTAAGGEGGSAELAQCAQRTGEGTWVVGAAHKGVAALAAEREGGAEAAWAWAPEAVSACGLFPFTPQPMAVLLQDAWVGVLGDSTARLFYSALLRAAGAAPEPRVLQGHRGFQHPLRAGARASFGWAPYSENVTEALRAWHVAGSAPDVVVMGASLWHMLHVGDAGAHGEALERMLDVLALLSSKTGRGPLLFWMSTTALVNHKLLNEQKRTQLTAERASAYEAQAARLLAPAGPCLLLDLRRITHDCGEACTEDGMHYHNSTYDALVQQWANSVRLERLSRACALAVRLSMQYRGVDLCEMPGRRESMRRLWASDSYGAPALRA